VNLDFERAPAARSGSDPDRRCRCHRGPKGSGGHKGSPDLRLSRYTRLQLLSPGFVAGERRIVVGGKRPSQFGPRLVDTTDQREAQHGAIEPGYQQSLADRSSLKGEHAHGSDSTTQPIGCAPDARGNKAAFAAVQ
jgi:hypothetical protein